MESALTALQNSFGEQRFRTNEPMAAHTVLKIGGIVDYYVEVDKISELTKLVKEAGNAEIPVHIIGTGSHSLFSDNGVKGLVIKNNCRKFDVISRKGKIRNNQINVDRAYVYADSGVLMNQLVRFAIEQNLSGLENHLGVSGSIGGNLYRRTKENELLNDYIYQIQVIDTKGNIKLVDRNELFITDKKGIVRKAGYIILSVVFELFPSHKELLWNKGTKAIEKRQESRTENVLSLQGFQDISTADAISMPTPGYTTDPAYLIEKAGLNNMKVGSVTVTGNYLNYVADGESVHANDYIELFNRISEKVYQKFGARLQPIPTIIDK